MSNDTLKNIIETINNYKVDNTLINTDEMAYSILKTNYPEQGIPANLPNAKTFLDIYLSIFVYLHLIITEIIEKNPSAKRYNMEPKNINFKFYNLESKYTIFESVNNINKIILDIQNIANKKMNIYEEFKNILIEKLYILREATYNVIFLYANIPEYKNNIIKSAFKFQYNNQLPRVLSYVNILNINFNNFIKFDNQIIKFFINNPNNRLKNKYLLPNDSEIIFKDADINKYNLNINELKNITTN